MWKDELILKTKSKRYTYNRINRMFIHILIGLKKEDKIIIQGLQKVREGQKVKPQLVVSGSTEVK